jgi:hypothetical protein
MNISTTAVALIIIDISLIVVAFIYLILSQKMIRKLQQQCWQTLGQKTDMESNTLFDGFVGTIAVWQIKMMEKFDMLVLHQAQKVFTFAVIYSLAGILFFFTFLFLRQPQDPLLISAVGSVLLELLSGANFYLYGRTSRQMAQCHARLFKVQNFLLAISVCKDFTEEKREETCAKIALIIANYSENTSKIQQNETTSIGKPPTPR